MISTLIVFLLETHRLLLKAPPTRRDQLSFFLLLNGHGSQFVKCDKVFVVLFVVVLH